MDWNKNSVGWNTGFQPGVGLDCRSVPGACKDNPDDMAFIQGIVQRLRQLGVRGRTYAVGDSNGAALCHKLAVNGQMGFSGIIAHSSQMLSAPLNSGGPPPCPFPPKAGIYQPNPLSQ